jgi:hypothetical protein
MGCCYPHHFGTIPAMDDSTEYSAYSSGSEYSSACTKACFAAPISQAGYSSVSNRTREYSSANFGTVSEDNWGTNRAANCIRLRYRHPMAMRASRN